MLKELRENKGLTQAELSKKLKISKKHLIKLEDEPHLCDPDLNLLLRISIRI